MSWHKEQIGFLTFAQNTEAVDYLRLAYLQALNIKTLMPDAKYAVVVDEQTKQKITESHKKIFDYIIDLAIDLNDKDSTWKLANEFQVFHLTPFKETIKLESDLLFTRDIRHWLQAFRLKDIVLSTGCKDYIGNKSPIRAYRKFFDDNQLPDIYNGLMYFRYSQAANDFFKIAGLVAKHWNNIKHSYFKNCRENTPSTDVLYAITAKIIGIEQCTLPSLEFINFAHMKPRIQGWNDDADWIDIVPTQIDGNMIRINNVNQYWPVHYYNKEFATNELIEHYEQRIGII